MTAKSRLSKLAVVCLLLSSTLASASEVECPRVFNNDEDLQLDASVGTVGITDQRLIDAGCFDLVVSPTLIQRNGRASAVIPTNPRHAADEFGKMLPDDLRRELSVIAYEDPHSGIAVMRCTDVRPRGGGNSKVGDLYRWARRYWKLDDKRSPLRVWFRESMRPRTSASELFGFLLLNFCKAEGK